MREAWGWLRRRAETVAAAMLAVMFAAFIIQIGFRYFFNFPIGWTSELTVVMWLWLVLWGSAFVLTEKEEIRFDLIYSAVPPRVRIAMAIVFALAIVVLYGASLPASYAYVTFMKVEKSSYLKIRLDWLYSIYLIFLVAIIAR
jgi:TRAP-type C4-dicarboxylate transport system permease small subunit